MMKKLTYSLAALMAGSLFSLSANSAILDFTFEGNTVASCTSCVGSGVAVTATYSFDTDSARIENAEFTIGGGTYSVASALPGDYTSMRQLEVLTITTKTTNSLFSAYNQFQGFLTYAPVNITSSNDFDWLSYENGQTYTGDFSLTAPFLGNGHIELTGAGAFEATWEAQTFSVSTVSAVPVPAALWLFAPAIAGLVGFSRKQDSSKNTKKQA